jgi:hypothetical protein
MSRRTRPRSTTPALFNAGVRFDATRLELADLAAELDRERPSATRLEQLRASYDLARPVIASPAADAEPHDVAEARALVIEIGRRLDRVQGRAAAGGAL